MNFSSAINATIFKNRGGLQMVIASCKYLLVALLLFITSQAIALSDFGSPYLLPTNATTQRGVHLKYHRERTDGKIPQAYADFLIQSAKEDLQDDQSDAMHFFGLPSFFEQRKNQYELRAKADQHTSVRMP
jgi:hypothetical protein